MKVFLRYLGAAASIICYAIVFFGAIAILELIGGEHYRAETAARYEASVGVDPKIAVNVNTDNFMKIKMNASYAEVCELLGGEGRISLISHDDGEPPCRGGDYVWTGENKQTKIYVLFDKENKVAFKLIYPAPNNETIPGEPYKFENMKNLKGMSYAQLCKTVGSLGSLFAEGRGDIYLLSDKKTHLDKAQTVTLRFFNSLYEPKDESSDYEDGAEAEEQAATENPEDEVGVFRAVFVDGVYRSDVIALPTEKDILATSNLL